MRRYSPQRSDRLIDIRAHERASLAEVCPSHLQRAGDVGERSVAVTIEMVRQARHARHQ